MSRTELLSISALFPLQPLLEKAAGLLAEGFPVVFPTETVYGLGADPYSQKGVLSIFEIKGRSFNKPLPMMISDEFMLDSIVERIPLQARRLMKTFWPGPLTIVFPAARDISPEITAGTGKIGVRFPDHKVALALIRTFGRPIVATSANLSGNRSPVTAREVMQQLDGLVPLVLDGGACDKGKESTVVDCSGNYMKILRTGAVPDREILAAVE